MLHAAVKIEKTSGNQPEVIHQSKNEQYFLSKTEKLIL
mgnify:CR=1 FL=1